MWRAKVFEDTDSCDSSGESDSEDQPAPKKLRTSKRLTKSKQQPQQRRKALLKAERQKLESYVKKLNSDKISSHSLEEVCGQKLFKGEDIQAFGCSVDPKALNFLAHHLQLAFARLFVECSTKKERYLHFQISWHKHCSFLLVEKNQHLTQLGLHPSDPVAEQVLTARSEWHKVKEKHALSQDASSRFLTLYCSSTLDQLLRQCHKVMQSFSKKSSGNAEVTEDSEDVFYRFGGAAIASMLHSRYEKLKQHCGDDQQLSEETTILQKLSIHKKEDKELIPDSLKYRDKGHMYFPCVELLPLIKEVDLATKEYTNGESFKKYGSELLTVISNKLVLDTKLLSLYETILREKIPEFSEMSDKSVDSVFKEFVRKLCHTRIQEFLDSFKQQSAAHKGLATLAGQNLRDSLLSHHVNLKSKSSQGTTSDTL